MYGAVYICNECLKECAENAGYLEAKHATQIQEENMQLSVQVFDLTKKADGLEKAINELLTGGFQYSKPVHREPSLLESIDLDREKSPGTEELVDTGAGAITESVHDEGVGELRSTSKSTEFELSI